MQDKIVYLNGEYLPLSEAKVSVLDRGFLFGDGIYEVIPAYFGKLFCLEAHLQRLNNSLNEIRLAVPLNAEQWLEILEPLLVEGDAQYIYLQITRGVADKRDHAFPERCEPTIFAMCSAIAPFAREEGVKAITLDDMRWQLCNIKATTLLANILLRQQAIDQSCAEAILIKDGYATEGAASNVFVVIDDVLITPANSNEILSGITRDVIIDLANANGISVREDAISEADLRRASEIWLTSSTREILPVITLDNKQVGDGQVGPIWQIMQKLFQDYKQAISTETKAEHDSPFEFPCLFPIKAMGKNIPDLDAIVVAIVRRHVDDLSENAVKTRPSKGGNFVSITVEVKAQSKAQLDAIYMDLTACPDILMSL